MYSGHALIQRKESLINSRDTVFKSGSSPFVSKIEMDLGKKLQ